MRFTKKFNFRGSGCPKKQYIGWIVCRFKRGTWPKRGGDVFEGVHILMHTSNCSHICKSVLAL